MRLKKYLDVFINSIGAGVLIALATVVYLSVAPANTIVAAFLFSVGLLSIFAFGLNLYTGRCGDLVEAKTCILDLIIIIFGNIVGCAIMATIMFITGFTISFPNIIATASPLLLFQSVICGMFIDIATQLKSKRGGLLITILCVMGFILSGGAHSVVWMFYKIVFPAIVPIGSVIEIILGNLIGATIMRVLVINKEKESY